MTDYYVILSIIILPVTRHDYKVVVLLLPRIYITTSSNYNLLQIAVSFVGLLMFPSAGVKFGWNEDFIL